VSLSILLGSQLGTSIENFDIELGSSLNNGLAGFGGNAVSNFGAIFSGKKRE
jgi:hypothetical protein